MKAYDLHDSGDRTRCDSGAHRDLQSGKGHPILYPWEAFERVSVLYEKGAFKYDPWNWLKGMPISWFVNSGIRHGFKYASGWQDEDHAAAVVFNFNCAMVMEEGIKAGHYPPKFDDRRPRWDSDFFTKVKERTDDSRSK